MWIIKKGKYRASVNSESSLQAHINAGWEVEQELGISEVSESDADDNDEPISKKGRNKNA